MISEQYSIFFTGSDFDFDLDGRLITPLGNQLVAFEQDGTAVVLNQFLNDSPPSIRFLPDGDLVLSMPNLGIVRRLDAETGLLETVLGGMIYPYGVETGADGTIYVADYSEQGRVMALDPATGAVEEIASLPYPLTLALSESEDTLFISSAGDPSGETGQILQIVRDGDGEWINEPTVAYDGRRADAMVSDVCGNLYIGTTNGHLLRLRASDDVLEFILDLSSSWLYAAHFGASYGGFEQTQLYVSNGVQVYEIDLGVIGRNVLAP